MLRCPLVAKKENLTAVSTGLTGRSKNLDPTGFLIWLDVKRFSNLRTTCLVKQCNPSILRKKPYFGRLHLWSHSFGHYSTLMTISENGDKNRFERKLCLSRQFSFHDNRIAQNSHYCTSLTYSGIQQFFVLPSVTGECNPNCTWTFLPASVSLHSFATCTDLGFTQTHTLIII